MFDSVKVFYERLKGGSHWYTVGDDSNFEMGDELECILSNSVMFSCVDLISDIMTQAKFEVNGEENETHPLVKLLNNPNPLQSKKDFIKESYFFKVAYGWVFEKPIVPTGFDPKYIYNLNPKNITYNKSFATRLLFMEEDINSAKERMFKYQEDNIKEEFQVNDVVMFFDVASGLSKNFLLKSPSRIKSIEKQLRNINKSLDVEYSAISKAGRFIVSGSKKGNALTKPIPTDEKKDIENNFGKYGHGRNKGDIIVSTAEVSVNSLHVPMNQLNITQSIEANAIHVMNAMKVPLELNPVTAKGATFENQEQAMINLIQNVVKVEMSDKLNTYKNYFGYKEDIKATFDHLDVMQAVEKMKAQQAMQISAAVRNLAQSNVSNISEVLENLGLNIQIDEQTNSLSGANATN